MVEMKVAGVILDAQSKHPIVMLRDRDEKRALLIWIGEPEANAILMALEGIQAPRPLTHDLLNQAFSRLEAPIQRIMITAMRDATFFASIECLKGGQAMLLDARPSDAIALALRAGVAIFVSEDVLEAHAVLIDKAQAPDDDAQFKAFVENVKPGDFGKYFSKD
jgi:bifunctional DNase/RNase